MAESADSDVADIFAASYGMPMGGERVAGHGRCLQGENADASCSGLPPS